MTQSQKNILHKIFIDFAAPLHQQTRLLVTEDQLKTLVPAWKTNIEGYDAAKEFLKKYIELIKTLDTEEIEFSTLLNDELFNQLSLNKIVNANKLHELLNKIILNRKGTPQAEIQTEIEKFVSFIFPGSKPETVVLDKKKSEFIVLDKKKSEIIALEKKKQPPQKTKIMLPIAGEHHAVPPHIVLSNNNAIVSRILHFTRTCIMSDKYGPAAKREVSKTMETSDELDSFIVFLVYVSFLPVGTTPRLEFNPKTRKQDLAKAVISEIRSQSNLVKSSVPFKTELNIVLEKLLVDAQNLPHKIPFKSF